MIENLNAALLITLIGMSLVFAAIILLWGLMALMTMRLPSSLFNRKAAPETQPEEGTLEEGTLEEGTLGERTPESQASQSAAAQAAALAVAVALATSRAQPSSASKSPQPHQFPLPPTAIVSAWQAVNRTNILTKRGKVR
jgi:hypothetical protein